MGGGAAEVRKGRRMIMIVERRDRGDTEMRFFIFMKWSGGAIGEEG